MRSIVSSRGVVFRAHCSLALHGRKLVSVFCSQTLLFLPLLNGLRLATESLQVKHVIVAFVFRFVLAGPLATLKERSASILLGLAQLFLGGLLLQAILFPLGKGLWRDGCEGARELVTLRLEEVFECEGP